MAHPSNKLLVGVVSAALLAAASMWEGEAYDPYWDLAGILTVCNGITGPEVIKGKRYTKQECDYLLTKHLKVHREHVYRCTNVPLTPKQFDAFTLFTYNVGGNAYCTSSLLKKLNKGDYKGACDGLLQWSYVKGKWVKGLNNRRKFEREMCLGN